MSPREIPAALWLVLTMLAMPVLSIVNRQAARRGAPPRSPRAGRFDTMNRSQIYATAVVNTSLMAAIALAVDWIAGGSVVRQALAFPPGGWWWIGGSVAVHQVVSWTTMAVRRLRRLPLDPGTARLLPRSFREYLAYVPVALAAGIGEEVLFRGFGLGTLVRWGVPAAVAVTIVTLSFGLAHGYKSVAGMLRASLLGLVNVIPVLVTGTLLPSIVAHTVMDLIAGGTMLRLARWMGVEVPEPTPSGL